MLNSMHDSPGMFYEETSEKYYEGVFGVTLAHKHVVLN